MNAVLFIGFTRVVRRRLVEMVRGGCCRNCRREQWTGLRETDQMTSSISINHPGAVGGRGGEHRDFGEGSSLTESDSLEGIQVLKFQSSFSSYGTTPSGD